MADLLVRDIPDEVMASLDAHAKQLGISRSEYVRRRLAADAAVPEASVRTTDLVRFSGLFADLGDPDVMGQAWQ
jgi:uncharacterized protein (DUF2384 family)